MHSHKFIIKMYRYLPRPSWSNYNLCILHYAFLNSDITILTLSYFSKKIFFWPRELLRIESMLMYYFSRLPVCCYATRGKCGKRNLEYAPNGVFTNFIWQNDITEFAVVKKFFFSLDFRKRKHDYFLIRHSQASIQLRRMTSFLSSTRWKISIFFVFQSWVHILHRNSITYVLLRNPGA